MASSMSAVLPPPSSPIPSNSDLNEDDEEYEYEEIEVEEEVEVEEEIEEEVSDDESDIGEDLTPVREEIQGNGIFQVMEPKEQEEPIKSSSVAVVDMSISKPPADIPKVQQNVGDSRISESSNKDLTHVKVGTSKNDKPNVSFEGSGVNGMKRKHFEAIGDVAVAMNDVLRIVVKTDPTASEFEEDILISPVAVVEDRQISPRLHASMSRVRDSFYIAEVDGESKRQRIVCEFYAKGWCIKGKNCNFLHTKDGLHAAVQTSEVEKEASSSAFISPHHGVENSTSNSDAEKLVFCKDNGLSSSSLPPSRESRVQNAYSDNFRFYAAPPVKDDPSERNGTYPGSRFDVLPDYVNHASRYSEIVNRKSDLNHCSSMSHHQPRQPISYSLSPWNIDAFGTKNHLKSEQHATVSSFVQQTTSPFSCSGSENLLRNRYSKVSSSDWEPSVPFRPSHDITRNLLLKESLYDPICDSIEQNEHVKSSSGEGSSMQNVLKKSQEDRGLNAVQVEDSGKQNVGSSSYDNRLSYDKPKNETEMKKDEYLVNEEKSQKFFQTELIDYIKELLKPTWREGLMSKEAYKLIVKKSSDKVLSSLQPDQIPFTSDSIKFYLSSSESKLAKLVKAYTEKYGKC